MAALKWVYVIFLTILMFELGSSLRVLTDKDKGTYKPDDLGFPAASLGDIPSVNVGPGGVFLRFGNGGGGSVAGSGSANINIGPGGIWIPGLPIPGFVTGQGEASGCSCDSCRTDGRSTVPDEIHHGGGGRGCTDTDCSPIIRSNGNFVSHGGYPLTPYTPPGHPLTPYIPPGHPLTPYIPPGHPLTPYTTAVQGKDCGGLCEEIIIPGAPVGNASQKNKADEPTKAAAEHD